MEMYESSDWVQKLNTFWESAKLEINQIKTDQMTFKAQELPLARIKKIMKLDEVVKNMMISAEAPILFAKAAELFIREITIRAWIHTERNKRRTLQRSDITLAVADGDTDQFDFLIDIVPRDEIKTHAVGGGGVGGNNSNNCGVIGGTKREETVVNVPHHLSGSNNNATLTMQQQTGGGAGGMNLFNQLGSHTLSTVSQPTATLLGGLVDSHGNITVGTNILQTGTGQQSTGNVHSNQPVQYVLQLPVGATTNSLSGTQAIQIQMIPQQTILSNAGGENTVTTLTTSGGTSINNNTATVINGQQQQQLFSISSGAVTSNIITQSSSNAPTTAVVLPSGLLTSSSNNSISVPITFGTTTNTSNSATILEQSEQLSNGANENNEENINCNNNTGVTNIITSTNSPINTSDENTNSCSNITVSVSNVKKELPSPGSTNNA